MLTKVTRAFQIQPFGPSLAKIDLDVFSYYYNAHRELFFSMKEHNEIREFYARVEYIKTPSHTDMIKLIEHIPGDAQPLRGSR
jgi:hypothetical protein